MPRVLVLGYSSIARRRLIPALATLDGVTVDIASRRALSAEDLDEPLSGALWFGFEAALESSEADLVYVSTANHDHAKWAERALTSGRHVIVDKPSFLGLSTVEAILEHAHKRGLCLAEATTFPFHPRYAALRDVIGDRPITRAHATFVIPPLPDTDFRIDPAAGGGAIFDLAPYAAGVSRVLKGEAPARIVATVTSWHPRSGVDTGFGLLATFADGTAYTGHFGFDGEYVNRLWANGPGWTADLERAYTPPPSAATAIAMREANAGRTVECPPADAFGLFVGAVIKAIEGGDWSAFSAALAQDARFLDRLQRSALGGGTAT